MSFVWLHEKPAPGRVVRDGDLRFNTNTHTSLSITQAMKNAESSKGEGFYWTADIRKELPVRISDSGAAGQAPITIIDAFADTVRRCSTLTALGEKPQGSKTWRTITWQEYWNNVCAFGKSLIKTGFQDRQSICIMGYNAPQWCIAHYGCIFANGIPAGIYTTNNVEATKYIIEHTESPVVVTDTVENAEKILAAKSQLPFLKYIVMYTDKPLPGWEAKGVVTWEEFLKLGRDVPDRALSQRMETQKPGHCCTLVYTSGTTGPPKGVMLSHDNCMWTSRISVQLSNFSCEECLVSFLPLSHIAAQLLDVYGPITCGYSVYFAPPDALKGSLVQTLQEVRPTFFFAVPRVWEKIEERMRALGAQSSGLRKALGDWAKDVGLRGTTAILKGEAPPTGFSLANFLVYKRIRQALGLDRCRGMGTGAAPMPKATQEYFMSLAIPINDIFGMSECTGPETYTIPAPGWFRTGSIGRALPGTDIVILNPDEKGHGEICWRGRNVFMGYFKNEEATRGSVDDFGFLHSGDIGYIDADGFVFITGRIKELIVTAGGENVPPVLIEAVVKEELPIVSNCQLLGDQRKFLALLLCLKTVPDANNLPTQTLAPEVTAVLKARGSNATTLDEARIDPVVHEIIAEGIVRINKRATSRAQEIRRWRLLPADFTQAGGELTATLKLRRKEVISKYSDLIEALYADPEDAHPGGLSKEAAARVGKKASKL